MKPLLKHYVLTSSLLHQGFVVQKTPSELHMKGL